MVGLSNDQTGTPSERPLARKRQTSELSYKFQRLRERLRGAIASGELAGKLPGERALAKRFHVNAKTLSKALTDLAAEGLLDRSIGRGTYVKGSAPEATPKAKNKWLIIAGLHGSSPELIEALRQANPETEVWTGDVNAIRPSQLAGVSSVVCLDPSTSPNFLRDMVVRNINVVAVGYVPKTYSTHCVLNDPSIGAAWLARELVLAGHHRFVVVERDRDNRVASSFHVAVSALARSATVDALDVPDTSALIGHGATAVVCDCPTTARHVQRMLEDRGIAIPSKLSVASVGMLTGEAPCSGFYTTVRQVAAAVTNLLRDPPTRPSAVWLAGEMIHCGTITETDAAVHEPTGPLLSIPRTAVA